MPFSLRRKLFLALLITSLVTFGAAGWAILNRIDAGARAEMLAQSRATALLTRELIERRGRDLVDVAQVLAMAPRVADAASASDSGRLADLARDLPASLDVTTVAFADASGDTLASAQLGTTHELRPSGLEGLGRALDGRATWTIERAGPGLALVGYAPIRRDGRIVGVVGLGEGFDQRFVERAKADTGFDCAIVTPDGRLLASTLGPGQSFPIGPMPPTSPAADVPNGGSRELVTVADRTFGTYATALRDPAGRTLGYVVVGSSLDELERARNEARRIFAGLGLLVVGINIAIAWALARRFTRPLQQLTDAARRMAAGDYGQPTALSGGDEIGELGRAFERMRRRVGESERLKSALLSTVSHELRTPLTHIKGYARTLLLDDAWDATSRREFLAIIDEECDRLRELVDNLLDMSRIEAGVLPLNREPLALRPFLERLVERQRGLSPDRAFALDVQPGVPVVIADARRIEQVVRNLLDNAVKYSGPGTTIHLGAYAEQEREEIGEEAADGHQRPGAVRPVRTAVVVEVGDEGIGIAVEDQPRVFERFYQVDGGLDRRQGGSGLGLSICAGIVRAHGGRIWVESAPGRGSTFCFALPAHPDVVDGRGPREES